VSPSKGIDKAEVELAWDGVLQGRPAVDLDLIAAVFPADDPAGTPAYLVHFDSRSPDGTITLSRESRTGQGFGWDEVMVFELGRMAPTLARVVIGVAIQQRGDVRTFGQVPGGRFRVREGHAELTRGDFASLPACSAATVGEFRRDAAGRWEFHPELTGFADTDPVAFAALIGRAAG
jgi:tellurium resistance protein TerD